jgi:hypothetical protein
MALRGDVHFTNAFVGESIFYKIKRRQTECAAIKRRGPTFAIFKVSKIFIISSFIGSPKRNKSDNSRT